MPSRLQSHLLFRCRSMSTLKNPSPLLIPKPISKKQRFCNEVVREVYEACVGKITSLTLLTYARSQREERWQLQSQMNDLTEMREKLRSSKDGNWINARKFTDEKVSLSYKTISMAKKTVAFLDGHIGKHQAFLADLGQRKSTLQQKTNMRAHTLNGIKFLEILGRQQKDVIGFLGGLKTTINDKLRASGDRTEALVEIADKSHKRKREKENSVRKVKDQAKRDIKSALKTLTMLEYENSVGLGRVEKGERIVIEIGELKLNKTHKLNQKMHLNGLLLLYEGGYFGEGTGLEDRMRTVIRFLKEKRESVPETALRSKKSTTTATTSVRATSSKSTTTTSNTRPKKSAASTTPITTPTTPTTTPTTPTTTKSTTTSTLTTPTPDQRPTKSSTPVRPLPIHQQEGHFSSLSSLSCADQQELPPNECSISFQDDSDALSSLSCADQQELPPSLSFQDDGDALLDVMWYPDDVDFVELTVDYIIF